MVNRQLKRIARSYGISKKVVAVVILAAATMGFRSTHEIVVSCEANAASYTIVRHAERAHHIVDGKGEIYIRIWEEVATEKRKVHNVNGKVLWDNRIPKPEDELIQSDYGYYVRGYPEISSTKYLGPTVIEQENVVDVRVTANLRSGGEYILRPDQYRACLDRLYKEAPVYEWYGVVLSTDIIEEKKERWPIAHLAKTAWTTLTNRCSSVLRLMWPDTTE